MVRNPVFLIVRKFFRTLFYGPVIYVSGDVFLESFENYPSVCIWVHSRNHRSKIYLELRTRSKILGTLVINREAVKQMRQMFVEIREMAPKHGVTL